MYVPFISFAVLLFLQAASALAAPDLWCLKGDGQACSSFELADPRRYKQVLVLPTGFTGAEEDLFRSEFSRMVAAMSEIEGPVYSTSYRAQMLYVGAWLPGGALGTAESVFGGKVFKHPIRGKALTLRQNDVVGTVDTLQLIHGIVNDPWAVAVLFNSREEDVTANAAPPTFLGLPYGIGKFTRIDLDDHYASSHEIAHAGLNFVDEYVERGLESMSIRTIDYATPLALTGQGWGWAAALANLLGTYDYRLSEILAANGTDNVDVTRYPSRVATPGYVPNEYEYEGGMFFGRGTYHDRGRNLMNSNRGTDAEDDGFGWEHSRSQQQVIEQAFEHPDRASRPNDRIRNAGPVGTWKISFGTTTRVLIFDSDKHHRYHPTRSYEVQVGWYERNWKVCWKTFIPYPCYDEKWVSMQKTVVPERRTLAVKSTSLYGAANLFQKLLCGIGIRSFKQGDANIDLCTLDIAQMSDAFLPTLEFPLPYQDTHVPASQWMTNYFWRFRTDNGTWKSGFTGWGKFVRLL